MTRCFDLCEVYYLLWTCWVFVLTLVALMFLGKTSRQHAWGVMGVAHLHHLTIHTFITIFLEQSLGVILCHKRLCRLVEICYLNGDWLFVRWLWLSLLFVVGSFMKLWCWVIFMVHRYRFFFLRYILVILFISCCGGCI